MQTEPETTRNDEDTDVDHDDVVQEGYDAAEEPEAQADGDPSPLDEAPSPEE